MSVARGPGINQMRPQRGKEHAHQDCLSCILNQICSFCTPKQNGVVQRTHYRCPGRARKRQGQGGTMEGIHVSTWRTTLSKQHNESRLENVYTETNLCRPRGAPKCVTSSRGAYSSWLRHMLSYTRVKKRGRQWAPYVSVTHSYAPK